MSPGAAERCVLLIMGGCSPASLDTVQSSQPVEATSASDSTLETPNPPVSAGLGRAKVLSVVVPDCPREAECPRGFTIDGEFWEVGCLLLSPESVADEIVATAPDDSFIDEVRAVVDTAVRVMAAAHVAEPLSCGGRNIGAEVTGWVAALGPVDSDRNEQASVSVSRAVCDHGLNPTEGDRCDRDGNISWFSDAGNEFRYSYFPEYQQQVDAQLAAGAGPAWRTNPTETAAQHWLESQSVCTGPDGFVFSDRCRAGVGDAVVDGSSATVAVTLQWAYENGDSVLYETHFEYITL